MTIRQLMVFIFTFFLLLPNDGVAGEFAPIWKKIAGLSPGGIVLLKNSQGETLINYHEKKKLIPASIIKFATALAAFNILGENYRFQTEFYTNHTGDLLIRGLGDPYLISEEIKLIAQKFKKQGLQTINRIFLDNSAFEKNIQIPGASDSLNPYDADVGALVVNFNTIFVRRNLHGRVFSAEAFTPLTPLAKREGQVLKPGSEERIRLLNNNGETLQYVGELFAAVLLQEGITVRYPMFQHTKMNTTWKKIYTHFNSRTLKDILTGMLKYSNNFIANQVFLTLGAKRFGYPATMAKGSDAVHRYLFGTLGIAPDNLEIEEGSGLSRETRITGETMMFLLGKFRNHFDLLAEKKGVRVKSGTLTGVYNYAGYFVKGKELFPFVIITNQERNNRNKILQLLKNYVLIAPDAIYGNL